MAEYTANALQVVGTNQNILLTETPVCGSNSIVHREGSGLVTLRGISRCQGRARFKVSFGANIAVPTGGTAGPVSLAIAISGEPIAATTMTVTPAAVGEFFNVYSSTFLEVPSGCCSQISVENISTQSVAVQNSNLIVERVA